MAGLAGFSEISVAPGISSTTGELAPQLVAVRPLTEDLKVRLQSELTESQESKFSIDYPFTPYLSIAGGWQTHSATEDVNSNSGAFRIGLNYRRTFPGLSILPPKREWRDYQK